MNPLTALTPTTITIATLAFLVAFLVNAFNSGKIFGIATVPQAWLPFLGVGIPFLTAVSLSLKAAGSLSGLSVFNAIQTGLFALLASAGGAVTHTAMSRHFNLHLKAAAASTAAKVGVLLLATFLAGSQVACTGAGAAVPPTLSCVEIVLMDAIKGMSVAEIVASAGPGCVLDAAEVATILLGNQTPQVSSTKAYGEAKAMRAAHNGGR